MIALVFIRIAVNGWLVAAFMLETACNAEEEVIEWTCVLTQYAVT